MGTAFALYLVKPSSDGTMSRQLSARYAIHEGSVYVLADHHGHLREVGTGPLTPKKQAILDSLARASYYLVEQEAAPWHLLADEGRDGPDDQQARRLAHGAALREEMKAALARGEAPTGYRAEWLQATARVVLETIAERTRAFNEAHADDCISGADTLDVLATAESIARQRLDELVGRAKKTEE